jgi:hypothetical protein
MLHAPETGHVARNIVRYAGNGDDVVMADSQGRREGVGSRLCR